VSSSAASDAPSRELARTGSFARDRRLATAAAVAGTSKQIHVTP